ncbi:MAG: tripartite tricarboxylate transporter substrate-binding protein [Cetobacterium sp.]|uniref:tripartite tricarboxylate transporter substrate-binding protein n=1 Tax=Cetobacterium sp. ZWU0022 TaxID=1340502 RepID=UPI0006488527|nr:tripartite tricarboxylate transporter substrate-binding protein [Cetobacterium sp. ZWU0022]
MKKSMLLLKIALSSTMILGFVACNGGNSKKKETVKIIVPYGAGGTADAIARKYGKIATENFPEYEFVAENKTGGDGFVASAYYQNINPKSKELFILGYGNAYRHTLGKKYGTEQVPYDLNKILPLATIDDRTWIVYAKPNFEVEDLLRKAKEGTLKMSGGNPLSDPHLALGSLLALENGKVTVVGYDGGAAQKQGLTSGEVDVFVGTTQAGMSDVEVGTIVPILAISEKGYSGFKGPNGEIFVPGVVENMANGLDPNKDYSSSILLAGGFIASRNGADPEWTNKVIEISKAVWATEEYTNWIQEIGLNKFEVYGNDAQLLLDEANNKAENAYKLLSGK